MTTDTLEPIRSRAAQRTRDVVSLFKLRIGSLIMVTALVGMVVTPGPAPSWIEVLVLALSVLVASASAGAFNQYVEHQSDQLMARTRRRAFVTGALPHHPAWLVLMGAMLAGAVAAAWLVLNGAAALYVFLGAFFYAFVYTVWLKRRSAMNIVIGGLAGSFAVLAGAAAVDPTLGPLPLLLALVLFLWTPPHFWALAIANRADYAQAGAVAGILGRGPGVFHRRLGWWLAFRAQGLGAVARSDPCARHVGLLCFAGTTEHIAGGGLRGRPGPLSELAHVLPSPLCCAAVGVGDGAGLPARRSERCH